jgi:hypothetical protein
VAEARSSNGGPAFTTPLRTSLAGPRSTGIGSPVSADSSSVAQVRRRPSTATISPEPTSRRSPGTTSPAGISATMPWVTRRAVRGARLASRLSARRARAVACDSSSCPHASIAVTMAPASGSSTSSVPTRASTAIMSTVGSRACIATRVHPAEASRPSTVPPVHITSASLPAPATAASSPAPSRPRARANSRLSRLDRSRLMPQPWSRWWSTARVQSTAALPRTSLPGARGRWAPGCQDSNLEEAFAIRGSARGHQPLALTLTRHHSMYA